MIYENFSNYDIDLKGEKYYSFLKNKEYVMKKDKDGYTTCGVRDDKGNLYGKWHQVVYCAINGITKDEFPHDEKGRVYEIDHIIPIRNGGTNDISNLRLVSKLQNANNPLSIRNMQDNSYMKKNKGSDILKMSEEVKKKLSELRKGKGLGEENPNWGNRWSDEQRKRLSEKTKDRYLNEKSVMSKKVYQYTLDGTLVKIWPSTQECARNGYNQGEVATCCRGGIWKNGKWIKRKSYKGYIWSYHSI